MTQEGQPRVPDLYADETARQEAFEADRTREAMPLPGAGKSHYSNEVERQSALAEAEVHQIARAAGELGLTSGEWSKLRSDLGRSPTRRDVRR